MIHGEAIHEPLFACFPEMCPHCHQLTEFWLIRSTGTAFLGFIPVFFGGAEHSLRCQGCGFARYLQKDEDKSYQEVSELFGKVQKGELQIADFFQQTEVLNVPTLRQIHNKAAFWICAFCQEDNPKNFSECWNCGARPAVGA
jgi:hypothetical protein